MEINKTKTEEKVSLLLTGRLDTVSAPLLQEALVTELEQGENVELDFAEVTYVSSAGLRVLLIGEKTAKAKGGIYTLVNVSDSIMEVFEMTGFAGLLKIN